MNFFTEQKLANILKGNKEISIWFKFLDAILPTFDINTVKRVAAYLAQTSHESNNYTVLSENLNYSRDGLLKTFPKYFDASNVDQYAKQPQKIANKIYANRMGNSSESSADGWKFRGRGILQITGKANYQLYSTKIYGDNTLINSPDLLATDKNAAIKSACSFWKDKNLNALADIDDIVNMTKKINGGTIGLQDRQNRYNNALLILS